MSSSEMLNYLARYCSLAERCLFDVRKKLKVEQFTTEEEKHIIDWLLKEKFVDEERYSRSFVHDKFHYNQWGRVKIAYELKQRGIPSAICQEALATIDEEEYLLALKELLIKHKRSVKGRSQMDVFQKLCRFASARGFETELFVRILKTLFRNRDDD